MLMSTQTFVTKKRIKRSAKLGSDKLYIDYMQSDTLSFQALHTLFGTRRWLFVVMNLNNIE